MPFIDTDVEDWTRDWRRLRRQKCRQRGGVETAMLRDLLLYEGETQSIQVQKMLLTRAFRSEKDKNKLNLVIPLARRLADRKIGRHWSIAHKYRATPNTKDPIAFDFADIIGDQLIPALDFKLQQDTLRWQILKWLVICGVCFEHVDYKDGVTQDVLPVYDDTTGEMLWEDSLTQVQIPESQVKILLQSGRVQAERFQPAMSVQETGDIGGDIYDPFRVFVDASVPMIKNLGPDQAVYLADIRTIEWCHQTFGSEQASKLEPMKDLSIIETQLMDRGIPVNGLNIKDVLPLINGGQDKDDPDMVIVLTKYRPKSRRFPNGARCFFVPDQVALDKDDNPYPEVPIIDYHWSAPGQTMWTCGFLRDTQSLSKFINKRFSQLGEAANAQIYELQLLGGNLTAKDIPTDFPGVVENGISDEGMPLVQPVPRGNLPPFFPDSIRLTMETLDSIGGSDLLSQRKFPGQLRGSLTIPMLQEIIDSEDGPRFAHLAEQFSLEKMMRINRVKAFYPPIRTLNYTGEDMRSEVLEFHADEVLRAGVDFTITVDPGSITPELSAVREARVRELFGWAPGLYVNPRTGQVDWTALATDLKYNYRQREAIATQGRKLARQFVQWARKGKILIEEMPPQVNPQTGQPGPPQTRMTLEDGRPFVILPFWAHNVMMDEYEAVMQTTEFIESSPIFQRVMLTLRDKHREIVSQMEEAANKGIEQRMIQGSMAQAAQQTAAKVAAQTADMTMQQIMDMQQQPGGMFESMQAQIRALMGSAQAQGGPGGPPQAGPPQMGRRRLLPPGQ